ncbi:MAG TPA: MaoC family dehydratase [bacterium]|nr:MaoC family dehydratase [bacterium]HOL46858.1 MaoC family dehydratase [bacterium]HPQ18793.1 MaoC family dehydratase [bacterium]
MIKGKKISELNVGDIYTKELILTEEAVKLFGEATGDKNPIHFDENYAANTGFKKRIVHGVLLLGVISGVLGMEFPGPGCIAREIKAKFVRPVFIGDKIKIEIIISKTTPKLNLVIINYKIYNSENEIVIKGEVEILAPI